LLNTFWFSTELKAAASFCGSRFSPWASPSRNNFFWSSLSVLTSSFNFSGSTFIGQLLFAYKIEAESVLYLAEKFSDRNPLDDVPRDFFLSPFVKPGRSQRRVPGQVLNIFQRHPLRQEVSDRRHTK
jgi:hypothetical protein